jgi:hypothetical protein
MCLSSERVLPISERVLWGSVVNVFLGGARTRFLSAGSDLQRLGSRRAPLFLRTRFLVLILTESGWVVAEPRCSLGGARTRFLSAGSDWQSLGGRLVAF